MQFLRVAQPLLFIFDNESELRSCQDCICQCFLCHRVPVSRADLDVNPSCMWRCHSCLQTKAHPATAEESQVRSTLQVSSSSLLLLFVVYLGSYKQKPGIHPNFRKTALGAKRPLLELWDSSGVFLEQLSEFKNNSRNAKSHSWNGLSQLEQCENHSSRSNSQSDSRKAWEHT